MVILVAGIATCLAEDVKDIVIADFEGKDYGEWKVTGEAFGAGPAQGSLPNQQQVTAFSARGWSTASMARINRSERLPRPNSSSSASSSTSSLAVAGMKAGRV